MTCNNFLRELRHDPSPDLADDSPTLQPRPPQAPGEHLQPSLVLLALDVVVRSPWRPQNPARR